MPTGKTPNSRLAVFASLALLFLAAAWFYAWAPATYPVRWTSKSAEGLYSELTAAYLHGHLHLAREPAPGLLALTDPYDPANNAPYRINDLSYFEGRYFLYHGAAPVLTLLAPFRLLTGRYLTDPAAVLIFCLGGAALSLLLLAKIRQQALPRASWLALAVCALAVLFCHGYYLVLRSSGTNHVAIASAYFFVLLALWASFRAVCTTRQVWPWLLLASIALGLAIASRPNYVFGTVALLVPIIVLWRRDDTRSPRQLLVNLTVIVGPLAAIIGGMLIHNYLRFGQPLEFGQRYMLGAWDQRTLGFFGLKYVPINAWHYLVSPGNLSLEFPFLTAISWQATGVLVQSPFVWLGLSIAVLSFKSSDRRSTSLLRPLAAMLALILICNLGLLLLLPSGNDLAVLTSANARYAFDFLPVLVLLACVGVLNLDHRLADSPWLRRCWQGSALGLALLSMIAALSLDFQRFPSECYRPLAQVLNGPVHLAQRWLGNAYGPVRLEVVFPAGKPHLYEPLIATGTAQAGDLLYVFYDSPETIRLGLVGTAMKGPLSAPIPVTYGQPHRLEISMGSLYPSDGNPALSSMRDSEVANLKRTLRVDLDGNKVFEVPAQFSPAKPRHVRIGLSTILRDYCVPEFSGQILSTTRLPIAALPPTSHSAIEFGAIRMSLQFPRGKHGTSEPLVVTGVPQAGDFIYAVYAGTRTLVIAYDHWGVRGQYSKPIPVDLAGTYDLEITLGSLYPARNHIFWSNHSANAAERLKRIVQVKLNGTVVLELEQEAYESAPSDVFIGRNVIGGSTCVYEFSGVIKSVSRLPLPEAAR